MAYSQKVVDKFEQTLKNPKEASVGRWKPGDKDFHRVGTGIVCLLYTSPSPRDDL